MYSIIRRTGGKTYQNIAKKYVNRIVAAGWLIGLFALAAVLASSSSVVISEVLVPMTWANAAVNMTLIIAISCIIGKLIDAYTMKDGQQNNQE